MLWPRRSSTERHWCWNLARHSPAGCTLSEPAERSAMTMSRSSACTWAPMRLPDLVAYQTAVQHPATAFGDADLRSGSVAAGRFGLPRAVAGNFAVTYQVCDGSRRWAVRCFHRDTADRAQRYAAISET